MDVVALSVALLGLILTLRRGGKSNPYTPYWSIVTEGEGGKGAGHAVRAVIQDTALTMIGFGVVATALLMTITTYVATTSGLGASFSYGGEATLAAVGTGEIVGGLLIRRLAHRRGSNA